MPEVQTATLKDRGVIRLSGVDSRSLLQNVITNDIVVLDEAPSLYAALLTPQGKILCDFFVVRDGDDILIDVAQTEHKMLLTRLSMYKLRSAVELTDASDTMSVEVMWGDGQPETSNGGVLFVDPRLADLGWRAIVSATTNSDTGSNAKNYHAHRIARGVPDGGQDFAFGDAFPHEALLDQLNGVSFSKGCYVGQEVVSRVHHRGTARKRIVQVASADAAPLPEPGTIITAGPAKIGTLGSSVANNGLALLRLDRADEAIAAGTLITAGETELKISIQPWAKFSLANASGKSDASATK